MCEIDQLTWAGARQKVDSYVVSIILSGKKCNHLFCFNCWNSDAPVKFWCTLHCKFFLSHFLFEHNILSSSCLDWIKWCICWVQVTSDWFSHLELRMLQNQDNWTKKGESISIPCSVFLIAHCLTCLFYYILYKTILQYKILFPKKIFCTHRLRRSGRSCNKTGDQVRKLLYLVLYVTCVVRK